MAPHEVKPAAAVSGRSKPSKHAPPSGTGATTEVRRTAPFLLTRFTKPRAEQNTLGISQKQIPRTNE